ncbi:TraI [Legionella santicrucis]|uniref:TraI n=1 Tax=Legionella santicrucis TaxID=45074 RepID=A0A0W0ZLH5_9GAMM|nr:toprim domain-containing protein [Legionella santicrucis]KTD69892.1 TraI [Legionella santicrucis]
MNDKGINDKLKSIVEGSQKQNKAVSIYKSASSIEGTLAEKYLVEHRHIPKEVLQHTTFKYDEKSKSLVTPIYDSRNILTGVQLVQLNEEGQKALPGNDAKKVIENRHTMDRFGRVAMIRQGTDLTRIYIAEGVETATSLLSVIPEEFTVVASLGIKEIADSIPYIRTSLIPGAQVVWLADNDKGNKNAEQQLLESKEHFIKAGFKIGQDLFIVAPIQEGSDWNDVLCDRSTSLKDSFELSQRTLETEYNHMDTEYIIEEPLALLDPASYEDAEEKETIEKSFSDTKPIRQHIMKMEEQLCQIEDYKSLVKILEKLNVALEKLKTQKIEKTHSLSLAEKDLKKINQMLNDIQKIISMNPEKSPHAEPENYKKKLEAKISEKEFEGQLCERAIEEILTLEGTNIAPLLSQESAFSQYFAKFDKEQNKNCLEGKLQPYEIKALVLEVHKKNKERLSKEIAAIKSDQLQDNSELFIKNVENSSKILHKTKSKIAELQKRLEQQNEKLSNKLEELYLTSLDSKNDFFCNMTLQWWYNNLSALKFSKPITYTLEPFGHSVELAHVEYLEGEEPAIEETIEQLADDILQRSGIAKQLKQQEKTSEQDASLYERSVKDYAYKLAINMHRSFSVRIPLVDSKQEQEFDGIAKRRFTKKNPSEGDAQTTEEYVILERKTNTGTRQGVMQTAFTQDKINSKMTFFKRGTEYEKFTHTIKSRPIFTAQDIVLCNKEKPSELKLSACDWYNLSPGSDVIERMDKAAKEILADALNTRNIEFVFNHPGHNVGQATEKNYFNSNFIQRAMLRVSEHNAGEEDEILKRLQTFYRGWMEKYSPTSQTALVSDEGTTKNSTRERTTDRNYCEFFTRNLTKNPAKDSTEPKLNNLHGA